MSDVRVDDDDDEEESEEPKHPASQVKATEKTRGNKSSREPSRFDDIARRLLRYAIIAIGLIASVAHIFFGEHYEGRLRIDLVALAWVGLAIIGYLLDDVAELGFAGVKLKLRVEELEDGAEDIRQTLADAANLVQNWSTAASIYIAMMQRPKHELKRAKSEIFKKYVINRMGEARTFLGDEPSEDVRITLWLYDPEKDVVRYSRMSIGGDAPTRKEWSVGEGMIGEAMHESFYETRNFNERDVLNVPSYINTRKHYEPPYKAILCHAVRWQNQPIAMLTVDKKSDTYFSPVAEDITKGLASQCAIAITQYIRTLTQ